MLSWKAFTLLRPPGVTSVKAAAAVVAVGSYS